MDRPSRIPAVPRIPQRILVVCIRRLGDVLLSSALIRSLRQAWPQARIEVLVNASAAVTLQGNPDIDEIIVQSERASLRELWRIVGRIFRRYDLAIAALYNDRPHLYAWLASARRAGVVPPPGVAGHRWKRWLMHYPALLRLGELHAVEQYLQVADALGIPRIPEVVPPRPSDEAALESRLGTGWRERPYAVLHPVPMYRYKAWNSAGWRELIEWLLAQGLRVVLSGGPAPEERSSVAAIAREFPGREVVDLAGQLQFHELTPLLERARLFVGPDTSVTHLAAAAGVPVVTLFGPSHPVAWGPWPQGHAGPGDSPWQLRAPLQHQGNVWIVQGIKHCVPCLAEGCDRHLQSRAECLDELPAARIIAVAQQVLKTRHPPSA